MASRNALGYITPSTQLEDATVTSYTAAQVAAMQPALGTMVYNAGTSEVQVYTSTGWSSLSGGGGSGDPELANLTASEIQQLENIGATTISGTQWGYLGAQNQQLDTGSSVQFAGLQTPTLALFDGGVKTTTLAVPTLTGASNTITLPNGNSTVLSTLQGVNGNLQWSEDYENASSIDLYAYSATYVITGGGTALKDAINLHGGGASSSAPNVYEINDDLVYTGGINLTNKSNIVVRGAVGHRPTIQVDSVTNLSCFSVSYTTASVGTTDYIIIGNMDGNITGTNSSLSHEFFLAFKSLAALAGNTISNIAIKDVFIYNTDYTTTGINMGGVVIMNDVNETARWATNVYIERCRFMNIKSRTDRAAIFMMGVENYIGRHNHVSAPDVAIVGSYSHSSAMVRLHATSGKEYYSFFQPTLNVRQYNAESNAVCYRIIQDANTYSGYAAPINFLVYGCTFANSMSSSRGALRMTYSPKVGASTTMAIQAVKCNFVESVNAGILLNGNSDAGLPGMSLSVTDCNFISVPKPFVKYSDYTCPVQLSVEANRYFNCGTVFTNFTNTYLYNVGNSVQSQYAYPTRYTPAGALTDGTAGELVSRPAYTATSAQTVTRHNYILCAQPTLDNVTVTNGCALQFDAASGTHCALAASSTKTTPTAVDGGWLKINVNGTVLYVPMYTSTTS